jgi:hypothetical protein
VTNGLIVKSGAFELGLNRIFLGLNGIDFLGFLGLIFSKIQKIPKNQSHLIPKKSH